VKPQSCLQIVDIAAPKVFISSTFTDRLVQVRDQIRRDLDEVKYLPLMSELGTFAYPHLGPVYDDTIEAVPTCEIYILIIGRRHGTVHPDKGKTITELEYDAARASGRPIFVYIEDKVWQGFAAHADGGADGDNYQYWVDDPRVFDFIERVSDVDACRCVPFFQVDDIMSDFRAQLANLLGGYLRFQRKASGWLWTEDFTRSLEREADRVWVLTPDFFWDHSDPDFRQIVFLNVCERGAEYFYLYSDTDGNRARVAEMARDYEAEIGPRWRDSVHYAPIPVEDFNWCTEQALYNAGDPKRERGIIVDAMDARRFVDKYNIELGREKRYDFRCQFTRLWERYAEGELGGAAPNATQLSL
jgi:hypothetical protein